MNKELSGNTNVVRCHQINKTSKYTEITLFNEYRMDSRKKRNTFPRCFKLDIFFTVRFPVVFRGLQGQSPYPEISKPGNFKLLTEEDFRWVNTSGVSRQRRNYGTSKNVRVEINLAPVDMAKAAEGLGWGGGKTTGGLGDGGPQGSSGGAPVGGRGDEVPQKQNF